MADMYILSPDDQVLTVLSSDGQEACRFWDAKYKEELNKGSSFSFVADASHPDARYLFEENQVIFRDKDGILRLFVIKELDDTDENSEVNTLVTCEAAMMELAETFVKDFRPTDKTAQFVLDNVLARSRWVAEVSAELGTNSTTFYKKTALECIAEVINIWGGELQDYIEFDGNRITKRIIKILPRRGKDSGKRFEIDKDTENIKRTVISYPLTALWGYGASIASTDEDGEETGGYSRFIDFSEVEWKKSKGDPVDKPLGQEWVGDPDLLKRLGRLKNGELIHREGQYNNEDITDPAELLKATYNHLITTASKTEVNYELSVQLLQNVPGYEHEHVELGDTTIAIDRNFAIPIETSQRIISMEYDITDPDNTCVVEIGQFLSVLQGDDRINQIESILDKNRGTWERKPDVGEVTDGSFPDTKPPVPTNVQVKALFQNIALTWDYIPSSYIAAYEVYASQIKGFTPLKENLIFRGKTGGYEHFTGVNELWYYRIRAINTRGTASDFTAEFSATTKRILTNDIVFGAVTAEKLANLAVTADKIARDFDEGNIFPGSLLKANQFYTYSDSTLSVEQKTFNEMTVSQVINGDTTVFGVAGYRGSPNNIQRMSLVEGQVYTLSFEVKRNNTTNLNFIHLKKDKEFTLISGSNLNDISSFPADEFVRVNIKFTAPATGSDYTIGIGGRNTNGNTEPCSFVFRKIQVRKGEEIKEYGYSPYDVMLTDGAIYGEYIQSAAIGTTHIQKAAITSAQIAEAAIGTAAIQNAAIKKAHLGTAIIDTAQIIDGAITNAKIKDLSADKINAGTIKGITIEGSLIKGGKFEALNTTDNYKSYFDGKEFYQFNRSTASGTYGDYTELKITSSSISQESGDQDSGGKRTVYRSVKIGDGKVSIYGSGYDYVLEDIPKIDLYGSRSNGSYQSVIDMSIDKAASVPGDVLSINASNTPANLENSSVFSYAYNTAKFSGSSTLATFKTANFEADVTGGIRLKSKNGTLIEGGPATLPAGSNIYPGNVTKNKQPLASGNVTTYISDIHGGLQYNLSMCVTNVDVSMPDNGSSTAYAKVTLNPWVDAYYDTPENIFAVMATPYGAYSNAVTVGIEHQSSGGFEVHVRGTGTSTGVAGRKITVRMLVLYEAQ
ncbi:phage tail spike protein [Bacillus halotolerans]|uniref:phage tail spike protein n=1 Tax=Bacillus halotolerans TaxID=260554 RepID=UPI002DBCAF7F|nr:phage tail spike protein [Bacillus halotolerans]MEC1663016.1 phage tail spike protein [Bacillus halotolerans]